MQKLAHVRLYNTRVRRRLGVNNAFETVPLLEQMNR